MTRRNPDRPAGPTVVRRVPTLTDVVEAGHQPVPPQAGQPAAAPAAAPSPLLTNLLPALRGALDGWDEPGCSAAASQDGTGSDAEAQWQAQVLDSAMQRIDAALAEALQRQLQQMLPGLREELQTLVQTSLREAVAQHRRRD